MVSERLKELRKALGLSQSAIAQKLEISQSNYAQYETGNQTLNIDKIDKLFNIFNVNPNWLITGNGDMFNDDDIIETEPASPIILDIDDEEDTFQTLVEFFNEHPEIKEKLIKYWELQEKHRKELAELIKKR